MHIYATLKCFLYTNAMIKHNVFHVDLNNKKSLELQWKFKKKNMDEVSINGLLTAVLFCSAYLYY